MKKERAETAKSTEIQIVNSPMHWIALKNVYIDKRVQILG